MDTFFNRVYNVVREIPQGKVATYGQIAKILGVPRWSQVVGYALHSNPDPNTIKCHRVVDRFGRVCQGFAFGGAGEQRKLLEKEGVVFEIDGTIDLKKYQWQPAFADEDVFK